MRESVVSSFAVRLRDLLSTLEVTSLLGAAEIRMRGLGEQLQFACLTMPCDQALVAVELQQLGRLRVPGVASAEAWRAASHDLLPSGTPFAYLLGGGGAMATELGDDDALVDALAPVLDGQPRHALLVPIRLGAAVAGGVALFRDAPFDDEAISMGERLAEVLALTLETHRTERILLQLFASMLPDLCGADAPTDFSERLEAYVHQLRIEPRYQDRLRLADTVGRISNQGSAETRLVTDLLARVEGYLGELSDGTGDDAPASIQDDLLGDDLYD